MKYQRSFIIEINDVDTALGFGVYIKDIFKNSLGYHYSKTAVLENAKQWRYKKNCQNSINTILNKHDPTRKNKYSKYSIIEITDNQILRVLKLRKISKNEN